MLSQEAHRLMGVPVVADISKASVTSSVSIMACRVQISVAKFPEDKKPQGKKPAPKKDEAKKPEKKEAEAA